MKKVVCILLGIVLIQFGSAFAAELKHDNNTNSEEIIVVEEDNNNLDDNVSVDENSSSIDENLDSEVTPEEEDFVSEEEDYSEYPSDNSEEIELLNSQKNAIYLDVKTTSKKHAKNKKNTKFEDVTVDSVNSHDFRISPQNVNAYRNNDVYSKKTTSFSNEKKMGNLSFGSKYDNSFTMNEYTGTRTLFSKYNINKLSFSAAYKNDSFSSFGQQFRGTFSFSPEYKLNDHISLQSIYSKNFMDRSNKSELIFNLKPFKDDRMNFNVGASQIYYEDATPMRSQLNFATKINF